MAYLFAFGAFLAGWENVAGIRDHEISGLGHVFFKAKRQGQPIRFWLIFSYNLLFLTAFVGLFFHELKP